MKPNGKRSRIIGPALAAAAVLTALFLFYGWTVRRGSIYERRAYAAAAAQDWDRAFALGEKAERYGAEDTLTELTYEKAETLFQDGDYADAKALFFGLKGYRDADERMLACTYALAELAEAEGDLAAALDGFSAAAGYRDALTRADAIRFRIAEQLQRDGDTQSAFWTFLMLGEYRDASERAAELAVLLTGETDPETAVMLAQGLQPEELDRREQLETLRSAQNSRRIAAGHAHAVYLSGNGTVRFAGDETCGKQAVEGWTDIVAVSAGYAHTLGLRADGRVVAAGDNSCGQCGVENWTDIVMIVCGPWDSYGIRADGTVVCCGYLSEQSVTAGWTDVIALSAGEGTLFAVRKNGTALGLLPDALSGQYDLCAVCPTGSFPAGLNRDGAVISDRFDLADWTDIIAIDSSATLLVGLRADGTLETLPLMPVSDALLSALTAETDVTGMSVAGTYVLLLHADGSVSAPDAPFDCSALQD